MKYFEEKLQAPDATKQQLECEVIDIPAHSLRNNLLFYNIEEMKGEEPITMGVYSGQNYIIFIKSEIIKLFV